MLERLKHWVKSMREMNAARRFNWHVPRIVRLQLEVSFQGSMPLAFVGLLCLKLGIIKSGLILAATMAVWVTLSSLVFFGTVIFIVCRNASQAARYITDPTHEAE